jgi:hypothetical protein
MKTYMCRATGLIWLVAGVWLAATFIIPYVLPPVSVGRGTAGLAFAGFAVFGAFAAYSLVRGRRWAVLALAFQALVFAALSIYYLVIWRFWDLRAGYLSDYRATDWQALFTLLLCTVTLIFFAIARRKRHLC